MRVTPLDIRKQEFKKVMRGLDSEEVFAFLNTIAEEYEAVLSDNKNLRERVVALEERLNEYKSIETNLRNTLLTAERLTQEAKENARREASLLIREAEMEAEKAAESIRAHTSQLRREILELKKNKDNYITRLKTLLDSHKKMLDGFEEDFAGVDKAIEKIGQQVEEDIRKPAAPPRMSRDKITENFGHEPKDKVTWGEERRREDEPRPQVPRPGVETRQTPSQKTKPPEDVNVFAAPGMNQRPSQGINQDPGQGPATGMNQRPVAAMSQGPATGMNQAGFPQQPGQPPAPAQRPAEQLEIDAMGATASDATAPQQVRPAPVQPEPSAAPSAQDDWRQYEVRKQPTDWKNYEIQGQKPPQQPPQQQQTPQQPPQFQQPAAPPHVEDREVESALSSLREAANAAEELPRANMGQTPGSRQAPAQPSAQTQPPPAQPVNAGDNSESTWSMEDLRRNLTNFTKDEGHQG